MRTCFIAGMTIRGCFWLNTDHAKGIQHRGEQNEQDAERCDEADHDAEQLFAAEGARKLDLLGDRLRLEEISDKDTGTQRDNGHEYAVADEIKEIEELHAEYLHILPCAVAERGGKTQQQAAEKDDHAGLSVFK